MASSTPNQPDKERPSSLESLERRLYSRTPPPLRHDEEFLGEERHIRIAPEWTSEAERKESAVYSILVTIMPWIRRLFVASLLFFMFTVGIAFVGIWRGSNTVSPQNISVDITAPIGIGAGEEMNIEIVVGNKNAIDLDSVDVLVEFPDGTRKPGNLSEPLLRYRDALGLLAAGKSLSRKLALVPFGEEGENKKLLVTVEYRPKDSNAIFSRKVEHAFSISSAPVVFTLDLPKEVNSEQLFDIVIDVSSNSSVTQENLLVKAEYPFGFQFAKSEPKPSFGADTWFLGDLKPAGRRFIRLSGKLEATEKEERTFRFSVGTQGEKDERTLGAVFLSESPTVLIQRPFINLELLVNGTQGETFVGRSGQTIRADISWKNNLLSKVTDLSITAKLSGDIFNEASVSSAEGAYDSTTDTLLWDQRKVSKFAIVEPGAKGTVSASFGILPVATDPKTFKNPRLAIEVTARGKRLDEQGLSREVVSSVKKEIKIATSLTLSSRLLHADGPLANQGPIPPRGEEETTYTIVWSLSNTSNGIGGATVTTMLPSYVRWAGETSPLSERISYNQVGGAVTWDAGGIASGVGVGTPPREVAFKVVLIPSLSHVGMSPVVIGESVARGDDLFAGVPIQSNVRPPLTTKSLSDPGAKESNGVVVK